TFICYLSIGLPLAVVPPYVHLRMGYGAVVAGLAVSIQYIATLASRPWAGRISDSVGAKIAVIWGMGACTGSGAMLILAVALHRSPLFSFSALIASRLILGVGESLGSTGATLWGISGTGVENTARVIGLNGVCTYGGMAIAAPIGVVLYQRWGLLAIGIVTILLAGSSLVLAFRKEPVPVSVAGEHLPFGRVLGLVAPHGMGLALGGISYSVLATFVTLYYASRHWKGAALCLTAFGLAYIVVRLLLIRTISRFGGFPVAMVSLLVEAVGMVLLWLAGSPWMALAGSAISGFGLSLVFPAIGVEAVKRVPEQSCGTALGVYTAFADVSFFLTGPIAGAVIGFYGYPSVFLFALISVLAGLGIVMVLQRFQSG
ncbi:MAG: MFS transporter, partial [Terracidiphilus sp.]